MPQSTLSKALLALAASGIIHLGVLVYFSLAEERAEIAGGATTEVAMLGNDFEDMVAEGDQLEPMDPVVAEDDAEISEMEPVEPDRMEPDTDLEQVTDTETPTETPTDEKIEQMVEVDPEPMDQLRPTETLPPVNPEAQLPAEPRPVVQASTIPPVPTEAQPRPDPLSPLPMDAPIPEPVETPQQIAALAPDQIEPIETIEPVESLEPLPELEAAPAPVIKPKPPAPPKAATKKKPPQEKKVQKKKTEKKQGRKNANSTANKKKGLSDGQTSGKSKEKSAKGERRKAKAGNAAVSNYPGKVQRRIARTRAKRVGGKGTARIRFVISQNGRISSISVARSSGSSEVDKAALDLVRRAAPFPKPPSGARRNFVIPVRVRG
ncbi:MAG: TonB family protein [Pseudomonadota bacterium]